MREHRSSGRPRLTARLPVLLLALTAALAAVLLGGVGVGRAQTAVSLVEVEGGGTQIAFDGERALGIATAASAGTGNDGWLVTEVELRIRPDAGTGTDRTATPPGLAICESDADGDPDGTCYPLIAPGAVEIPVATTTGQEVTYATPGSGHFLTAGMNYTLHFTENGSTHANGLHHLDASGNDGEAAHVAGTFRNALRELRSDGTWGSSSSNVAWARITGYASTTPTETPPGEALISNIGQMEAVTGTRFTSVDVAQEFTTGTDPGGYTLTSIELRLRRHGSDATTPPTVKLLRGSPSGAEVATLSGPSALAARIAAEYTFRPSAAVTLSASTRYVVVAEGGASYWQAASPGAPDGTPGHGWAIKASDYSRTHDSTGAFAQGANAVKLRVNGTVNPLPPLISNVGKAQTNVIRLDTADIAQGFMTGPHPSGYDLHSIDLPLNIKAGVGLLLVTLHSGAADGTKVADLTPQASGRGIGIYRFTPTREVTLSASTSYWVVAADRGAEAHWSATNDSAYDDDVASGWSFADLGQSRRIGPTGPFTTFTSGATDRLLMRINGVLAPPAPLVSNLGQTTSSGTGFRAGSISDLAQQFTTGANPGGYTLTGVEPKFTVTTDSVAPPTVTLHSGSATGTKVADFTGPVAVSVGFTVETFTPTTAVTLSASTDYWVVLEGGSDDIRWPTTASGAEDAVSAGGWTIAGAIQTRSPSSTGSFTDDSLGAGVLRIYGRITPPANAAATGAPFITAPNVFRVPAVLTADISGIADANGIVRITDRARYEWQRFAADGTTLEAANIGTGLIYRLTDADAGKKIRVLFSFTDDAGYAEALTSAATDAVTAEAACAFPPIVGGMKIIWDGDLAIGRGAQSSYGFNASVGSLGVPTFSTPGPNTHEILSMVTSSNNLIVGIDTALSAADKSTLVLHVCDKAFRFSSAPGPTSFLFVNADLDFSGHAERYISLSQDTAGPTLVEATVNGTSLVMTFNEELAAAASLANSAFTVKKGSGGTTQTLSGSPSISGSTVTLTLATAVTATDTDVKVLYTKPSTGTANKLVDTFGNEAATFTADQDVGNLLGPRVSIVAVHDDATPLLAGPVFTVTRSDTSTSALTVNIRVTQPFASVATRTATIPANQTTVTWKPLEVEYDHRNGDLTARVVVGSGYAPADAPDNSATVEVKVLGAGRSVTTAHRQTAYSVEEGESLDVILDITIAGDVPQPREEFTAVNLTSQSGTATPADDYIAVSGSSVPVSPSDWTASGGGYTATKTVTIQTVEDTADEGNEAFTLYFSTFPGNPSAIGFVEATRTATITIVDNETLQLVSVAASPTPAGGYYAVGNVITFKVTFTAPVTVTGTPQFAFDLGGATRQAAYGGGTDSKELGFFYSVLHTDADDHDGISWAANSLSLNGGTIKRMHTDPAQQVDAPLSHAAQAALPRHKVDKTEPTFVGASVNGTTLTVTFSEELDTTAVPANSDFTVKKGSGGTEQTLSSTAPSISGRTVTLTLATAVTATETDVKVAYTKPSANLLKDLGGREVDTFADQDVVNALADSVPPELSSVQSGLLVKSDGLTVEVKFTENLKETSVPDKSAFTVEATPAGGSEAAVALASSGGVTVSGSTVVLKLAVPITHNDGSVKVTYTKPATGAVIEDANGNDAASFADRAVTNNSTVPRVSIERVYADASSLIANPVFLIRRSNTGTEALTVELSLSQDDTYLDPANTTDFIVSGQTEKEVTLPLDYAGNTSGNLTVTVVGRSQYAPALAPNNAATVQVRAPASGLPLSVRFSQASWTVDEGATVDPTLTFTLAPGLAEPRDRFTVPLETTPDVADSGDDFVAYPEPRARAEPGDWQPASGGGKTQTVAITYVTIQDTLVEPNEVFHMRFDRVNDSTEAADIPSTLPDERTTISILDDDPLEVTDVEVTSTPTGGYYGVGDKIEFTVTFSGLVEASSGPQFAFDLGGATRQAAYASGSDTTDLVFSYTAANTDADDSDGISWGANALSFNGGTIVASPSKDLLVPRNADLDHAAQAALPGHKVDTTKPTFMEASVSGTTLTVTFSEDLDTTAAPANSAFTVKKGSGGTAQTLSSTAPSISGATVTLTLATASAVTATDTDVKVAYTKPSANPLKDLSGKEMDTFADQDVVNQLADSTPPELAATDAAVLAADGVTLTLTYNEALKTTSVPGNSVFTVEATPAGSSEAAVALASSDGVTVSGSTVVLKLAVPIAHNDGSVKVTYEKPATGAVIEDANGNDAAGFTDRAVTNNSAVPRVSIERVYADASPGIANPAFRVRRSNSGGAALTVNIGITQAVAYLATTQTITIPAGNRAATAWFTSDYMGNTSGDLTATVSGGNDHLPAVAPDNSATVRMKVPASGPTVWVSHEHLSLTVNESDGTADLGVVFSTGAGVAKPRVSEITVAALTAQGTASINRDYRHISRNVPVGAGDWRAVAGGSYSHTELLPITILDDDQYERSDETFIVYFRRTQGVTIVLNVPGRNDPDGSATVTIVDDTPDTLKVSSVEVTSTPTADYYGATDTIEFTVTFTGNVTVTGAPQFAFDLGGTTHQVAYTSGSGSQELVFSHTVVATDGDDHDGISWAANALSLNGGAIKFTHTDVAEQVDADLDHAAQAALPGHKVEAAKPAFVEASVNGTTLTVTFSEDLDTTAAPANSAFTVKKGSGGTAQTLSSTAPSISGATVTLTLATAVTATDTDVKVAYTKPSANPLKDLSGKEVDTFGDEDVFNELADSVPPELAATDAAVLAADGLTLTLTYNEALKTASVPAVAAFTVKATPAGGSEAVVALASSGGVTVSGSTVVLKLAVPITHNDSSVKVSYAKPTTGAVIEDANGNDAADFTDRAVTNNSTAPRVSIERVHADASPGIAHAEFRVTRSNTSANALTVNIEITQADTYLDSTTETITIPANATSMTEQFESYYEGNTSGDLTATVSGGDGYVPAVAPNNAATVRMKAPSSGRTLTIAHQQGAYSVTEGSDWSVTVTFSTGVGVAQPRQDVQAGLVAESGTAISGSGNDFRTYGTTVTVAASDWTAAGGAFTATKAVMDSTLQDDEYEGSEQFDLVLHRPNPLTVPAFFSPTCPPGTPDGTDCLATITITDDDTLEVTDVEVTSTPTGGYYDPADEIDFTATLNGKVNVTGTPRFAFELGGETRSAAYTLGASGTTELVFRYVVATGDHDDHDGVSWGANALSLDGGTIKFMHTDTAQQVNANLNHAAQGALPGQKVDTTKPGLEEAEVDGATLSMFFSEELNTAAPANSAFTVRVDAGTGVNPTAVSISGSVVTLTLATAVTQEQTVTVSYTSPASNKIRDLSGKEADAFTDRNVDPASDIANFRATPGNRRVRLEWDNPGDSTIQRYQYRLMNTSDGAWNPDWRSISGSNANTTAITATGLRNGIEYTFQVRPLFLRNQLQTMGKEGEIKSVPRGPLVASRNLAAASAGDGELALSWDDPGDITITGYQYRYRNPSDSGWNPDWTDISGSGATTTSHTLSGLTNNVLYTVEVRSLRGVTGGPAARATQQPRGPIVVPANFAAASGEDRRATLSWDNSGDDSISRFQYRYRISTVSAWNPDWTDIPGSRWNTTSYTVRSLVNLIGYTFELRALRGTLEGPASSDTATPEGPPSVPLPPQGLTVHPADRSLGLSWDPPVSEDSRAPVTGYRVRYREEGRSWRTVSRPTGLLGWQTIAGLRNGSAYEVQVASVNSVGAGAWTETRGVPEAPQLGEPPPQPVGNEGIRCRSARGVVGRHRSRRQFLGQR